MPDLCIPRTHLKFPDRCRRCRAAASRPYALDVGSTSLSVPPMRWLRPPVLAFAITAGILTVRLILGWHRAGWDPVTVLHHDSDTITLRARDDETARDIAFVSQGESPS